MPSWTGFVKQEKPSDTPICSLIHPIENISAGSDPETQILRPHNPGLVRDQLSETGEEPAGKHYSHARQPGIEENARFHPDTEDHGRLLKQLRQEAFCGLCGLPPALRNVGICDAVDAA